MAQTRIHFSPSEIFTLGLVFVVAASAALLTLLFEWHPSQLMYPLFFPLFPGIMAHVLITGVHGGTAAQETVAVYVAAAVNGAFYAFIIFIFKIVWRSLSRRHTAYRQHPAQKEPK